MQWRQLNKRLIIILNRTYEYKLQERYIDGFAERRLDVIVRNGDHIFRVAQIMLGFEDKSGEQYLSVSSCSLGGIKESDLDVSSIISNSRKIFNNSYLYPEGSVEHLSIPYGKIYLKEMKNISLIEERNGVRRIMTNRLITFIFPFFAITTINRSSENRQRKGLAFDGIGLYQMEYSYDSLIRRVFVPFPKQDTSTKYFREIL